MITEDVAWLLADFPRVLGKCSRGLRVCDLGNQHSGWQFNACVKHVMKWLGYDHVSIDINGLDDSLALDLSKPLPIELLGTFDLVTNAGTTEHVNTTVDFVDQWQAFKSVHDLARKDNAVFPHVIPNEDGRHAACRYVYRDGFLSALAKVCNYEIIYQYPSKTDKNHLVAMLKKHPMSKEFPGLSEFMELVVPFITCLG